ncbi:hypothetical protein ACI3ME_00300 (plasmid) [Escherichia coli]
MKVLSIVGATLFGHVIPCCRICFCIAGACGAKCERQSCCKQRTRYSF